ncbi:MAG: hypothetical protein AB3N14_14180, partial [Flavobacteriaceae bacterium]
MKKLTSLQKKIQQGNQELSKLSTKLAKLEAQEKKALSSIEQKQKKLGKLLRKNDASVKKVNSLKKQRTEIKEAIKNLATANMTFKNTALKESSPQILLNGFSTEYPILLFPVRTQTRFIRVKHVATGLQAKDLLDLSETPRTEKKKISGLLKRQEPFLAHELAKPKKLETDRDKSILSPLPLSLNNNSPRSSAVKNLPQQKPTSGFKFMEDKNELWVRIYPDDIFVHTHEEGFSQDEIIAAQNFWEEVHRVDTTLNNTPSERYQAKVAAWRAIINGFGTFRASYIVRTIKPETLTITKGEPILKTTPKLPNVTVKDGSWTKPPYTYILPDQFVVRLYASGTFREVVGRPIPEILILGLPPENEDPETFELQNEARNIPEDIKWLTDFHEAEKVGMAIRIPISSIEATKGFEKTVVLGVKLSQDEKQGAKTLSRLFENHQFAMGGMSLLKQGTPTNNTTNSSTLEFVGNEEEDSLKATMAPQFNATSKHADKRDGQFLAEALGITSKSLQHIQNTGSTDICEAIAINKALYPATIGYALQQFYGNTVGSSTRANTRAFFQDFVLGRGLIPAFRVDNQPYGIILSSSLSQWSYTTAKSQALLKAMHKKVITPLLDIWRSNLTKVQSLNNPNTTQNNLSEHFMDILGLHASSIDFYQRIVAGPKALSTLPGQTAIANQQQTNKSKFQQIFSMNAGWILDYGFLQNVRELNGPVIDRLPLSESRGLENLKGTEKNYIDFLIESGIKAIEKEAFKTFSPENPSPPYSLLYLLLRHSMLREYLDLATRFLDEAKLGTVLMKHDFELDQLTEDKKLRPEHEELLSQMILAKQLPNLEKKTNTAFKKKIATTRGAQERKRIAEALVKKEISKLETTIAKEIKEQKSKFTIENNKFKWFDRKFANLTGNQTLGEFIEQLEKEGHIKLASLKHIKSSLGKIKDLPTARLERCFAEHLDCCNYRLDAWQTGLYAQRLSEMRKKKKEGIYLGAFAILEGPRPSSRPGIHVQPVKGARVTSPIAVSAKKINPVIDSSKFDSKAQLNAFLKKAFVYLGSELKDEIGFNRNTNNFLATPVEDDTISGGFVHTPSTNQAISAAILKSGFDAHRAEDELSEALAVNLNSKRVRKSLYILQGMRNGEELGTLLGYQFERALHDHPNGTLDQFILDIRALFPSSAENNTGTGGTQSINSEVLSVTDGHALLKAFQKENKLPSKISALLGTASQRTAVEDELIKLDEILDAVNDLMVAESIFQIVVGSPDGSSAALKVLNESGDINQMPEIINVPRKGNALSHKVGIQLPIDHKKIAWKATASPPRTKLNTSLNNWVAKQLPAPDKIILRVENSDGKIRPVSMADLKIEPLEFVLGLGRGLTHTQSGELPVRAKLFLAFSDPAFANLETLTVLFKDIGFSSTTKFCIYELLPLVSSLYQLITGSRAALPEDMITPSSLDSLDSGNGSLNNTELRNGLTQILLGDGTGSIEKIQDQLSTTLSNLAVLERGKEITKEDNDSYLALCEQLIEASGFDIPSAIPQTHIGFNFQTREVLRQQAHRTLEELEAKKVKARELFNAIPGSDAEGGRDNFENL